jgi:hypothetical protein
MMEFLHFLGVKLWFFSQGRSVGGRVKISLMEERREIPLDLGGNHDDMKKVVYMWLMLRVCICQY